MGNRGLRGLCETETVLASSCFLCFRGRKLSCADLIYLVSGSTVARVNQRTGNGLSVFLEVTAINLKDYKVQRLFCGRKSSEFH